MRVVMEESGNPCHPLVVWEHCCSDFGNIVVVIMIYVRKLVSIIC